MDGFYLPDAPEFDQWMEIERAKFTRAASRAIESLAAAARADGRSAEALEWRQRLAAITPDDACGSRPIPSGSTIAVLPFSSIGDAAAMSPFADGVSEEVMHALARNPELSVVSPRSAFAYRDTKLDVRALGRRLRVDWIVEGSIRRAGDRLRIVAQLTDAKNGYQAWSESFDRRSSDPLAVQQEIASAIAARVVATECLGVSSRRASA